MARGRGVRPDGRSKRGRFLMLPHSVYDHDAFRLLKPPARAVLIELIRRHNGVNNGRIALPIRAGRALGLSQATTSRAIRELITAGLVRCARPAAFTTKTRLAAEYRLTWLPCDGHAPTLDYRAVSNPKKDHSSTRDANSSTRDAETRPEAA